MHHLATQSCIFRQYHLFLGLTPALTFEILSAFNSISSHNPDLALSVLIWLNFLAKSRHTATSSGCVDIHISSDVSHEKYTLLWPRCVRVSSLLVLLSHFYAFDFSTNFYNLNPEQEGSLPRSQKKPTFLINGRLCDSIDDVELSQSFWNRDLSLKILTRSTALDSDHKVVFLSLCHKSSARSVGTEFTRSVRSAIGAIEDATSCEQILMTNPVGECQSRLVVEPGGNTVGVLKDADAASPLSCLDVCYNYRSDGIYRSQAAWFVIKQLREQCGFQIDSPAIHVAKLYIPNVRGARAGEFEEILGSVQEFIEGSEHCDREAGYGVDLKVFQELALLDMLVGNFDSSEENLLLRRRDIKYMECARGGDEKRRFCASKDVCDVFNMYSIDHDYTFPDDVKSLCESEWFWDTCIFAKQAFDQDLIVSGLCGLDVVRVMKELYCQYGVSAHALLIMFVMYELVVCLGRKGMSVKDISWIVRDRVRGGKKLKLVSRAVTGIRVLEDYERVWSLERACVRSKAVCVVRAAVQAVLYLK